MQIGQDVLDFGEFWKTALMVSSFVPPYLWNDY